MRIRLLLGAALTLLGGAGTVAARSAADSCVDAGYRPGTSAFTSCIMHIEGDDPSVKLEGAPQQGPAASAEHRPVPALPGDRLSTADAPEVRLLERERPGGPALMLLNGEVVSALSPSAPLPGGAAAPRPVGSNPVGLTVPAPVVPSLPGMQAFSAPNWPWGGGAP
jgi:hypothetical protein